MATLLQHAKRELRAAGLFDENADYNGDVAVLTTSLMEVFAAYGHSGGSKEATIGIFTRLANGMPLTPLTGEDDEWEVPAGKSGQMMVNKRCYRIFKDDEMAWDVKVGRTPLTFPHLPE